MQCKQTKLTKHLPAITNTCIRTKFPRRRPKQPETRGRAPQKPGSGQSYCHDGPNDRKREGMHHRSAPLGNIAHIEVKKHRIYSKTKKKKAAFRTCPRIQETGNLVDKVVLPLVGVFFQSGGPENGLAGPAFTREKSTLILFKSYGRDDPRSLYMCTYVYVYVYVYLCIYIYIYINM